ncbi:sulfite exporter TauE/SafE family protein [Roseateles depolymerans]|uniref:Membrane-bounded cytochrome biogenesis DsbD/cycZ-like domain n=1 Tax=Roseateles depolymerans TaxID=76731 RepID=A0A0U3N6C8_9BURK|nr:sulfite exporter TauE/SafE family protein [Roseateles depolymerans]ALV07755.1 Membrane-bounded cytochrome biogenesis DsbD/cycZ-like domain [Roseateles depolymerans]REG22024.1 hypothetical protein DES44_1163 [Roseateles depolymerans]
MLDVALMGSAFLMGMAGSVHCVSMCAAPCAAVTGGRGTASAAFHAGRLASYSLAGAVAASSIGLLWQWEQAASWLRPLWLGLHLAVLALGLWLLWRGEQPLWMQRRWERAPSGAAAGSATGRSTLAGLAWVAWPCGLLQSALLVAALATGPVTGALVMAAFALGSSPGLWAGPWLLRRLAQARATKPAEASVIQWWGRAPGLAAGPALASAASTGLSIPAPTGGSPPQTGPEMGPHLGPDPDLATSPDTGAAGLRWATRLSGLLLSAAALWALGHGLWVQIRAYCG